MPIIKSAKKRVRVTARQTAENHLHRQRSRTAVKRVREYLADGKPAEAAAHASTAQAYLDKAAKRGALPANAVARYKSSLSAALKKAGHKGPIAGRHAKTTTTKPAVKKATATTKPAAKKTSKPAPKKPAK